MSSSNDAQVLAENARRIFVALDVADHNQAVQLAQQVAPYVGGFKVGLELFTACGPQIVENLDAQRVFLDLKLHDIPNTVAGACRVLARLGAAFFDVHCLGGLEMMRAGVEAAQSENADAKVIGITILTSHDAQSLARLGLSDAPRDAVKRLALLAREAGLHGVVCSPHETALVREECGADFLIVTPGVRPASGEVGDQKRVATPQQAMENGADFLVIGRPITQAADPARAAREIFAV